MIKDALDFLARIQTPKNPTHVEIRGEPFAVKPDGTIGEYIRKPDPNARYPYLQVSTLSALVSAYNAMTVPKDQTAILVGSEVSASVISVTPDEFGKRDVFVMAQHDDETDFGFDEFMEPEQFIIKFRAGFLFNEEATKVQQLCSSLQAGSTVSVADDGMSQTVVITTGTINKAPVTLPAEGVPLIPWRTFRDAAPVESKFLLRMKTAKDSMPKIALFEIDQKWKLDTIASIARYLKEQLPEAVIIA